MKGEINLLLLLGIISVVVASGILVSQATGIIHLEDFIFFPATAEALNLNATSAVSEYPEYKDFTYYDTSGYIMFGDIYSLDSSHLATSDFKESICSGIKKCIMFYDGTDEKGCVVDIVDVARYDNIAYNYIQNAINECLDEIGIVSDYSGNIEIPICNVPNSVDFKWYDIKTGTSEFSSDVTLLHSLVNIIEWPERSGTIRNVNDYSIRWISEGDFWKGMDYNYCTLPTNFFMYSDKFSTNIYGNVFAPRDTSGKARVKITMGNLNTLSSDCKFNFYICPQEAFANTTEDTSMKIYNYFSNFDIAGSAVYNKTSLIYHHKCFPSFYDGDITSDNVNPYICSGSALSGIWYSPFRYTKIIAKYSPAIFVKDSSFETVAAAVRAGIKKWYAYQLTLYSSNYISDADSVKSEITYQDFVSGFKTEADIDIEYQKDTEVVIPWDQRLGTDIYQPSGSIFVCGWNDVNYYSDVGADLLRDPKKIFTERFYNGYATGIYDFYYGNLFSSHYTNSEDMIDPATGNTVSPTPETPIAYEYSIQNAWFRNCAQVKIMPDDTAMNIPDGAISIRTEVTSQVLNCINGESDPKETTKTLPCQGGNAAKYSGRYPSIPQITVYIGGYQ